MRRKLTWLLLSVMLFALTAIVAAQADYTVTINTIDDIDYPNLRLLVTVENALGQPVNGLTIDDFSALADGRDAQVIEVEELVNNDLAVSVVMVLDSSQSMYETPLLDTKAAASILLDNLRPQDEVAIVDFDDTVRVVQPFTTDIEAARAAINGLIPGGRTRLYDAATGGVETALTAMNPRRFVILLTDGNEYGELSENPAEAAPVMALENGIPFFTIGIGFDVNARYLESLASVSNGEAFITPDSDNLEDIFSFISGYLRSQYIVTIAPDLEPDGSTYDITLNSGSGTATGQYTSPDLYPVVTLEGVPDTPIDSATTFSAQVDAVRGVANVVASSSTGGPAELANYATSADGNQATGDIVVDPLTLAPGTYDITIEGSDLGGGIRAVSREYQVASVPTTFSIDNMADGAVINDPAVAIAASISQAQVGIESVTYLIDGIEQDTLTEAPYP
ncbi:MAG: VWA domain-containing protein, partial [Anaerolineae bacterium]|nr:VWA domain-containing protein [Anaerolineae bacterium]